MCSSSVSALKSFFSRLSYPCLLCSMWYDLASRQYDINDADTTSDRMNYKNYIDADSDDNRLTLIIDRIWTSNAHFPASIFPPNRRFVLLFLVKSTDLSIGLFHVHNLLFRISVYRVQKKIFIGKKSWTINPSISHVITFVQNCWLAMLKQTPHKYVFRIPRNSEMERKQEI